MNIEELKTQITRAEGERGALEKSRTGIGNRINFLTMERDSLSWPIETGDAKAAKRFTEVENELEKLESAKTENAAALEANSENLAALRAELAAVELSELAAKRNQAALAVVQNRLQVFERRRQIDALIWTGREREVAARRLEVELREKGGSGPDFDMPLGSSDKHLEGLKAQMAELTKALE